MIIDELRVWAVIVVWVWCTIIPGGCFVIPKVRFEVLHPHGLRVSIPHIEGIKLFSFHGAVNDEIRVNQQGTIHGEVTEAINRRWTFTDSRVVIKGDDVINYWIYVQFNNLAYHVEAKQLVTDITHGDLTNVTDCSCCTPVHHHHHYHYYPMSEEQPNDASAIPNTARNDGNFSREISFLENQLNRTRDKIDYIETQLRPLREEFETLKQMVYFIRDRPERSDNNELLLVGMFPVEIPNLVPFLENFMREKLGIMDFTGRILTAHHPTDNEIIFRVSATDKRLLLRTATERKLIEEGGYLLTNFKNFPNRSTA
ncbi:hypothetical protein DMENIID0001_161700 [Sergentomyia squamirostris]